MSHIGPSRAPAHGRDSANTDAVPGAARRARATVAAVLAEEHRAPVHEMLERMRVIDAVAPPGAAVPLGTVAVAGAVAGRRVVRLTYAGSRTERITRLEVLDEVAPPRDPALLEADLARWPVRRLSGDEPAGP